MTSDNFSTDTNPGTHTELRTISHLPNLEIQDLTSENHTIEQPHPTQQPRPTQNNKNQSQLPAPKQTRPTTNNDHHDTTTTLSSLPLFPSTGTRTNVQKRTKRRNFFS